VVDELKNVPITDFSGGLNTYHPATELQLNQSPDLDNIYLLGKGFKKREGDSEFNSTAMNSGKQCQMVAYYKEAGGNEFLVAIAGSKVYKSDSLDGTMDEIAGAGAGHTDPTDGQNNIYTPVILKNLLMWFGASAPQSWDGSTATNDYQTLAGTPPTADFAFTIKDRVFAGKTSANPSTLYWCVLSNPEDWSGTGSGNTAVVTNDGDNLVGGIQLNNNLALLFKQYSIHHLVVESSPFPVRPLIRGVGCCGKHAMVNANGMIYFITKEPRMKSTDGYSIYTYSDSIDDLWDGLNKSRLDYIQGIYDPVKGLIHWVCSYGTSTTNNYDLVWDIKHKCWLRNTTGFDANTICLAQGYRLFAGHYAGKIYEKYKSTVYEDASETDKSINGYWRSGWLDFGDKFSVKQARYADIICKTQTRGLVKYSYGYNFNKDTREDSFSQESVGGKWDTDTWDDSLIWGGEDYRQSRVFMFGEGNNFQTKIFNDVEDDSMEINSLSLAVTVSGESEITR